MRTSSLSGNRDIGILAGEVRRLEPAARALLDLSLRRGFSDLKIGQALGIAPGEVARRRLEALDHLGGRGRDRARVEATLRGFGDDVWLAREAAVAEPHSRGAARHRRSAGAAHRRSAGAAHRRSALAVLTPAAVAGALVLALGDSGSAGKSSSASDPNRSSITGAEARAPRAVKLVAAPFVENGPIPPTPVVRAPVPVQLRIPDLGIDAPVRAVGASPAGIDVPPVDRVGWFDGGPRPGEPGRTVLVGHVDSFDGPAIFATLSGAQAGQTVQVTDGQGDEHAYRVDDLVNVEKARFPASRVYAPTAHSTLALITCGGPFDESTGHYENSIIVFASPQ